MTSAAYAFMGSVLLLGAGGCSSSGRASNADAGVAGLLDPIRAAHKLPALGGMVLSSEGAVAIGMTGVRKLGEPTLATIDDQWHLGSDTKAMTAAIVARLAERQLIRFDETLGELFPADAAAMDVAYRTMPLTFLLSHRSGMGDFEDYPDVVTSLAGSTEAVEVQRALWTKAVLARPPILPPDTMFHYSNSNYIVVGAALERRTGMPWEQLIAAEVFGPLAMSSCGFGAPGHATAPPDQPWGHLGTRALSPDSPDSDNPPAVGPAGTVHCSLSDWARFVSVFLGAHPDYLSLVSRTTLTTPKPGTDYALGWAVVQRPWAGGTAFTHLGSNTFWVANAWVAPAKNRAFLAVTNRGDESALVATDQAITALVTAYLVPPAN